MVFNAAELHQQSLTLAGGLWDEHSDAVRGVGREFIQEIVDGVGVHGLFGDEDELSSIGQHVAYGLMCASSFGLSFQKDGLVAELLNHGLKVLDQL